MLVPHLSTQHTKKALTDNLSDVRIDGHRSKDRRSIVKEIIRTRQLLEHLQRHSQRNPIRNPRRLPHPHKLLDRIRLDLIFGSELTLNLLNLRVHGPVVLSSTVDFAERLFGAFGFAMAEFETGCFGEEEDTDTEDDGPDPAEADHDAPGGGGVALVSYGAVVEAGGEEDAHGDEELV